ncbi:His-Xaa-Ser system protein HxsD [Polaromonas sp. SP1]|nr:His-Xaa-Ser system protein HxsD [Polaromonas sp. SP1]AYQ26918.1 His-Xaa-Ser system protein HxsD [Polaromonas sp. SP1]
MPEIRFDSTLYSADTIKRALYRMSDRLSADIQTGDGCFICTLHFLPGKSPESIAYDVANFRKEVLDQDLREKIRTETESVRNLILAHAFSKTGLIADEQVSAH